MTMTAAQVSNTGTGQTELKAGGSVNLQQRSTKIATGACFVKVFKAAP